MTRTYEVIVKGKYWPKEESLWIEADSVAKAISKIRRKARIEMWYDRINDGPVTYRAKQA